MLRRQLTLAPVLALLAGVLLVLAPSTAHAADRDCGDFATQAAAQDFFIEAGGPQSDPHQLDGDGNGVACESNPCPCSTSTGGAGGAAPSPSPAPRAVTQYGRVVEVVDGDTVDVRLHSGVKRRVRLVGIDTPEVYGGVECGGPAASRALKQALPRRTRVKLVSDPTQDAKDRYGRLLRYVTKVSTRTDMNRRQLWLGNARVYVYDGNPFKRVASYRAAQRDAQDADRGVWRHCR